MKTRYTSVVDGQLRAVEVEQLADRSYAVTVGDEQLRLQVDPINANEYHVLHDGRVHDVLVSGNAIKLSVHGAVDTSQVEILDERELARAALSGRGPGRAQTGRVAVEAPMPGRVVKLLVALGDVVEVGQGVIVVEAMKMENELKSSVAGKVVDVAVGEGAGVESGDSLLIIDASAADSDA